MSQAIKSVVFFFVLFAFVSLYASAVQWEPMILYSWQNDVLYKVTSEYENPEPDPFNPGTFSGVRLFDGDKATCWAEGVSGSGIGEALFFRIPEGTRTIDFINGFARNEEVFLNHNRVKKMIVSLYVGISPEAHVSEIAVQYYAVKHDKEFVIELEDTEDEQTLDFPLSWAELKDFEKSILEIYRNEKEAEVGSPADAVHYILRMDIQEVYEGSQMDVTCISEIKIGKYFQSVSSIYLSQDESAVLIDTNEGSGIEIDRDNEAVFQIISTSQDNQWIICTKMPKRIKGRVETEYVLYNTLIPKKIGKDVFGPGVLDMYGFVERNGELFLEYFNSETSQIEYFSLEKIGLK
ncbi:MAG: NADase-type glycan-binding domain-containing protein [Acidobacteriota bacterium]